VDEAMAPIAERMPWPGYEQPTEGRRLLSWSWATTQLERSPRYWLATAGASGAPHLTAVWGVWVGGRLVFSTGRTTRKARNLAARADCSVSTEGAKEAVVVEGVAEEVRNEPFAEMANAAFVAKYGSSMLVEDSPVFAVRPRFVNGIVDSSTTLLPTRWRIQHA